MRMFRNVVCGVFTCIAFCSVAQPPANDNCSTATDMSIGFNTQWLFDNLEGATGSSDFHPVDSICSGTGPSLSRKDVWYRFVPTRNRVMIKFKSSTGNYSIHVMQGPCEALSAKHCDTYVNSSIGKVDSFTVGPLQLGIACFLRIYKGSTAPIPSTPYQVSVEQLDVPNVLRSTVPGGMWTYATTWQNGIVPLGGDSVVISEGSTVTANYTSTVSYTKELAWLSVGGEDSTQSARLVANGVYSKSSIVIGKKDTVYGMAGATTVKNVEFKFYHDLVNHGGIKADNLALNFLGAGTTRQRFYGTGAIGVKFCNYLAVDNPGGVDIEFPLRLYNNLGLIRGKLNFIKPGRYHIGNSGGLFSDTINQIVRHLGSIEGDFGFQPSLPFTANLLAQLNYDYGMQGFWAASFSQYKNLPDTSRTFGKEYSLGTVNNNVIQLLRPGPLGWKQTYGNNRYYSVTNKGHWLGLGPNDTLFAAGFRGSFFENSEMSGFENVTLCMEGINGRLARINSSGTDVPLRRNGKVTMAGLFAQSIYTLPLSQRICFDILPQKPTGLFPAPVTSLQGQAIFFVNSNEPLPDQRFQVSMWYNLTDSMKGNPFDIRLCQSMSPSGPWKVISDSITSSSNISRKHRESRLINWADGRYFCWATTAKVTDMAPFKLLPPPAYGMGCEAAALQKVGVIVKNLSSTRAQTYKVGYRFEDQPAQSYTVVHSPGTGIVPLANDTVYLDGPLGLSLPEPRLWSYKIWTETAGDEEKANDTLAGKVNYKPAVFPYLRTFDSIPIDYQYGATPMEVYPNLPYQWYDSIRTEQILADVNTYNNIFRLQDIGSPPNRYLVSRRYLIGKHTVYTGHIGPIASPATWQFKYRVSQLGSSLDSMQLRAQDTIYFEASDNCGTTWKQLWKLHRGNQQVVSRFLWAADSLPFPAGSTLVFRLVEDIQTFSANNRYGTIAMDSLWIKPGVIVTRASESIAARPQQAWLFPNPAHSQATLQLPDALPARVELFDAQGRRRWFSARAQDGEVIPLRHLPRGIYTVRFYTATRSESQKLLVE